MFRYAKRNCDSIFIGTRTNHHSLHLVLLDKYLRVCWRFATQATVREQAEFHQRRVTIYVQITGVFSAVFTLLFVAYGCIATGARQSIELEQETSVKSFLNYIRYFPHGVPMLQQMFPDEPLLCGNNIMRCRLTKMSPYLYSDYATQAMGTSTFLQRTLSVISKCQSDDTNVSISPPTWNLQSSSQIVLCQNATFHGGPNYSAC